MSHEDIAAVWSTLSGRQDIANILREVIGTHALNVSFARRDSERLREVFLHHITTLRVILDLQRTYLQSWRRSTEAVSSLLPPELLFSAVLHLLDVIVVGSTSCPDLSSEGPYNRLTIHTALAGLRTLQLRRRPLTARQSALLRNRFEEIHERGQWHATGLTITLRLCRQIIQALTTPESDGRYAEPACGVARLPDFFAGLYLLHEYEKSIIDASRTISILSLQSSNWFYRSLAFYDLFWSTTAALIQLCLVRQQVTGTARKSSTADQTLELDTLKLVLGTRYQLRKQACCSPELAQEDWAAEQFLGLMLQDMHPVCAEEKCQCFGTDSVIVKELRVQYSMQSSRSRFLDKDFSESPFDEAMSKALQHLQGFVEERSSTAVRPQHKLAIPLFSSHEIESTGDGHIENPPLKRAVTSPHHKMLRSELSTEQSRPPLPSSISSPLISRYNQTLGSDERYTTTDPASGLTSTNSSIPRQYPSTPSFDTNTSKFSETTADSEVFSYRSAPLSSVDEDPPPPFPKTDRDNLPELDHRLPARPPIHEKPPLLAADENFPEAYTPDATPRMPYPEHNSSWQPDRDNHPEVAPPQRSTTVAPSIKSQESDGTSSFYHPTATSYVKPKKWHGLFGAPRVQSSSSPPVFTFFASGNSLLFWNEVGAGCYDLHDAQSIQFRRINVSSVCAAAGGTKRCAVVVKGIPEYRLEVYEGSCDTPLCKWKLDSVPYAIAISRDDNFIAAKFSKTVKIFQIDSNSTFKHDLPPSKSRSGRGNHLVTFSTDSLSFVATTRYEPEKVVTYWSECTSPIKATSIESTAPTGFPGDNGLSSLICSSAHTQAAFLATFTEKAVPSFLSMKSSRTLVRPIRDSKGRIGTRIHGAALCPVGKNLVLLNQRNDLFWVDDCWTGVQEPRRVGTLKRSVGVMKEVEVGMPNSEEVHLFWVEKGKGILVTMGKGGGKTKPIELVLDLDPLVA